MSRGYTTLSSLRSPSIYIFCCISLKCIEKLNKDALIYPCSLISWRTAHSRSQNYPSFKTSHHQSRFLRAKFVSTRQKNKEICIKEMSNISPTTTLYIHVYIYNKGKLLPRGTIRIEMRGAKHATETRQLFI